MVVVTVITYSQSLASYELPGRTANCRFLKEVRTDAGNVSNRYGITPSNEDEKYKIY